MVAAIARNNLLGILDLPELRQEALSLAGPASFLPLRISREEGEGEAAVRR